MDGRTLLTSSDTQSSELSALDTLPVVFKEAFPPEEGKPSCPQVFFSFFFLLFFLRAFRDWHQLPHWKIATDTS